MFEWIKTSLSRRALFGSALVAGTSPSLLASEAHHGKMGTMGNVDNERNGFDPYAMLTDWDPGVLSAGPDGRPIRTFKISALDRDIEIAPNLIFPAWTYNGRVPGPTLRVTEGDIVRVEFTNYGTHPHNIHFHGIHAARMDGLSEIAPGESFIYEFEAKPFGCHLYHCHSMPLQRHVHKGLYGAFIVDPDPARHPEFESVARSRLLGSADNVKWQELLMVMNGFDVNFDHENEVYAVNSIAHAFAKRPIKIDRHRPVRVYLVNITEFDLINSFHLHANFFQYYDHGTTLTPTSHTIDTVMQCQGQRGILEFSFADHEPGMYMFHAHQTEFAEQGWSGFFEVV
ncbi:MAG: FtsP/CotA-like multicopper oxidase with cupredoxin domain [Gammaproteobacteria bacterium]|jgi:FtsP/CotA-like multicopper oxidase with cupredoxin domain